MLLHKEGYECRGYQRLGVFSVPPTQNGELAAIGAPPRPHASGNAKLRSTPSRHDDVEYTGSFRSRRRRRRHCRIAVTRASRTPASSRARQRPSASQARASAAERFLAQLRTPQELSSPGFMASRLLNHLIAPHRALVAHVTDHRVRLRRRDARVHHVEL
jgi:hypothetical protein